MNAVERFLKTQQRNAWIGEPGIEIYVRKGYYFHPTTQRQVMCFVVANVSVDLDEQDKGTFTEWLRRAIDTVRPTGDFEAIQIENVLSRRFTDHFRRLGWIEAPVLDESHPRCFFLDLDAGGAE
jgi:hypothetical protein